MHRGIRAAYLFSFIKLFCFTKYQDMLLFQWGPANATGLGKETSARIFIDDDTGKPVAYVPSRVALKKDGAPFIESKITPEVIKNEKDFKNKYVEGGGKKTLPESLIKFLLKRQQTGHRKRRRSGKAALQ